MERHEPGAAHHALMADLNGVISRYETMPALERVALVSQFLGHRIGEVPSDMYSPEAVMACVARNLAQGNSQGGALALAPAIRP